jgi:hypothetical protein
MQFISGLKPISAPDNRKKAKETVLTLVIDKRKG